MNRAVLSLFRSVFGGGDAPVVRRAPGRVNLIGEHVDTNLGPVLPIGLDLGTDVAVRRRAGRRVRLVSRERGTGAVHDLDALPDRVAGWAAYPLGVVRALRARGVTVGGFDLAVAADLEVGAGLSSSASLLVATARALDAAFELGLSPGEHADLAYEAETRFVGVPCGRMDPLVCAWAEPATALRIDCRDLSVRRIPVDRRRLAIVLLDSGTRRSLTDSPYDDRVRECRAAVDAVRRRRPEVESLRDVTQDDLEAAEMDELPRRRARHVVDEIARVDRFAAALASGDFRTCGRLADESHASLRDDYDASTAPLDALQEGARRVAGVFGARLTGAGWGGHVVVFCEPGAESRVAAEVLPAYRERFGVDAVVRPVLA